MIARASAVIVAVAIFAPTFWLLMDREFPFELDGGEVLPRVAAPGGRVEVHWHIRWKRYCDGWVARRIVDSKGVERAYAPVSAVGGLKRADTIERTFELPSDLERGPAHYQAYTCYECNPIQRAWPICRWTPALGFDVQ